MDLFPDLPCLSAFDHAIVLVRGETPLWIDPTSRFSPFDELPVQDKGRLALVANETTTDLTRTPRGTASDNGFTSSHVVTMMDTSLEGLSSFAPTIQFEQTAGKALEAGHLCEAVVAYHELLQKYPEDFVRHAQFAAAVLPLGLGDLARTHAQAGRRTGADGVLCLVNARPCAGA